MEKIKELLHQVEVIIRHYKEISHLSGEDFNIFKIIDATTDEVKVHSAFIAELLNPQGLHGQGAVFLELFVKLMNISNFNCEKAKVEVEKCIGPLRNDDSEGGRLDIIVSDNLGQYITIENKIYAGDQRNQLIRYHKYSSSNLFYLTLDGKDASEVSVKDSKLNYSLVSGEHYTPISYREDIIGWLEACRKEAATQPVLREGITHYINLIKYLTNQSINKTMNDELIKTLVSTPGKLSTACEIAYVLNDVKANIQWKFWEELRKALEEKVFHFEENEKSVTKEKVYDYYQHINQRNKRCVGLWIEIYKKEDVSIYWGCEIDWRFISGFSLKRKGEYINPDNKEYEEYRDLLAKRFEIVHKDERWMTWNFSSPVLNFYEFNSEDIYKLADPIHLKKIVNEIAEKAESEINSFKKVLNKED